MSVFFQVEVITGFPSLSLDAPDAPQIDRTFVSGDYLEGLINLGALELAMTDSDSESIAVCATVFSSLVYSINKYIELGKAPIRIQHRDIVGQMIGSNWTLFMPQIGVVIRCDASCSVGSQTFERIDEYINAASDQVGSSLWSANFLGTTIDGLAPPVLPFWTAHIKTAEVI